MAGLAEFFNGSAILIWTMSSFPPTGLEPTPAPRRRRLDRRSAGGVGAGLLALAAKGKAVLLAIVHLKFLVTAGSMLVSIAAYASIWGLRFALGFVVLLFVHEMGHVLQVRREGGHASLPLFIPFLGAMIAARDFGGNAAKEARIGLAGPILGTIGTSVCFFLWKDTGDDFWRALAYVGFFLNLFNLIPVLPLDGGRAMAAMTPLMWIVGYAIFVGVIVSVALNPIAVVFLLIGAAETWRRWKAWRSGSAGDYYQVAPADRATIGISYIVLVAVLALGMHATYLHASFA